MFISSNKCTLDNKNQNIYKFWIIKEYIIIVLWFFIGSGWFIDDLVRFRVFLKVPVDPDPGLDQGLDIVMIFLEVQIRIWSIDRIRNTDYYQQYNKTTVCLRRLVHFYVMSILWKLDNNFWTYSIPVRSWSDLMGLEKWVRGEKTDLNHSPHYRSVGNWTGCPIYCVPNLVQKKP